MTSLPIIAAAISVFVGLGMAKLASGPISRIDPDLADYPTITAKPPRWLTPVVWVASIGIALVIGSKQLSVALSVSYLLYAWTLILAAAIDARFMLLPDRLTQPLLWAGMLCTMMLNPSGLHASVLGAVAGYMSLWTICHITRIAIQKEGFGYGDFKLFAAIGAWQGYAALPTVLLIACGIQILVVAAWPRYRQFNIPLPFGPCLAFGALSVIAFGTMV